MSTAVRPRQKIVSSKRDSDDTPVADALVLFGIIGGAMAGYGNWHGPWVAS